MSICYLVVVLMLQSFTSINGRGKLINIPKQKVVTQSTSTNKAYSSNTVYNSGGNSANSNKQRPPQLEMQYSLRSDHSGSKQKNRVFTNSCYQKNQNQKENPNKTILSRKKNHRTNQKNTNYHQTIAQPAIEKKKPIFAPFAMPDIAEIAREEWTRKNNMGSNM